MTNWTYVGAKIGGYSMVKLTIEDKTCGYISFIRCEGLHELNHMIAFTRNGFGPVAIQTSIDQIPGITPADHNLLVTLLEKKKHIVHMENDRYWHSFIYVSWMNTNNTEILPDYHAKRILNFLVLNSKDLSTASTRKKVSSRA